MLLLLFTACSTEVTQGLGRVAEASEDAHGPTDSSTRTPDVADQSTGEQHPQCSHRTDHRQGLGNGTIVISLELEQEGIFTLRPVTTFSPQDTYTTPSTQVLGYDPRSPAEFLAGEDGVVYQCDGYYWLYVGDLDVDRVLDSHSTGISKINHRNYHEDGTLRDTSTEDFPLRVSGLVFHQ